jgi:carbon storage regulator
MLVLKRKLNQSIIIGNDIEVEILGVEGDQVKLGIRAPKQIEVHRKEIYLSIQDTNKESALGQSLDFLKSIKKEQK